MGNEARTEGLSKRTAEAKRPRRSVSPRTAVEVGSRALLPIVHDRGGHWSERSACAHEDPEMFFSDASAAIKAAKEVCNTRCEVKSECLEEALESHDTHGTRGGLSPRQLSALMNRS